MRPRSPEAFTEDLVNTLNHLKELAEEAEKLNLTVCFQTDGYVTTCKTSHYLDQFLEVKLTTVRQTTHYYKDTD